MGDHDKIRAFQKHGPTLALTISSSSEAVWKKAFCNSMDGSFGERITARIGKFTPGISVCPSNKTSTNFQHCGHSATSALAGHAGNGTTPATQCWCLLKEERACFSSWSGVQSAITVKGKAWQPSMRSVVTLRGQEAETCTLELGSASLFIPSRTPACWKASTHSRFAFFSQLSLKNNYFGYSVVC